MQEKVQVIKVLVMCVAQYSEELQRDEVPGRIKQKYIELFSFFQF